MRTRRMYIYKIIRIFVYTGNIIKHTSCSSSGDKMDFARGAGAAEGVRWVKEKWKKVSPNYATDCPEKKKKKTEIEWQVRIFRSHWNATREWILTAEKGGANSKAQTRSTRKFNSLTEFLSLELDKRKFSRSFQRGIEFSQISFSFKIIRRQENSFFNFFSGSLLFNLYIFFNSQNTDWIRQHYPISIAKIFESRYFTK